MLAKIFVTPKKSVLDPQGEAVRKAIHTLGMECVESARIGKYIELKISGGDLAKTKAKLDAICRDLLSNPVIEDYELVLDGAERGNGLQAKAVPAAAKAEKKAEAEAKAPKKADKETKSTKDLKSTAKDKTSSKKKKKK